MARAQDEMTAHIRNLENNYQSVLGEMVNFQRNMAQQDGLMQNLIQYFLQVENGGYSSSSPQSASASAGAPQAEGQREVEKLALGIRAQGLQTPESAMGLALPSPPLL